MGRQIIAVAVILVGLIAGLAVRVSDAEPWSLAQVTDRRLTPEILKESLPSTYGVYLLNTAQIPGFTFAPPRSFATQSENLAYYDPANPNAAVAILVNISTLRPDVEPAEALTIVSEENAADKPRWVVEEQDLSLETAVPYLMTNELNVGGGEFWSISWGVGSGNYLFSVSALSATERDGFVRLLIDRISYVVLRADAVATTSEVEQAQATVRARETAIDGASTALAEREGAVAATVAAISPVASALEATGTAIASTAVSMATENAEIAAVATENAISGANALATAEAAAAAAQATIDALVASGIESAEDLATAQARLAVVQSSVATLEAQQEAAAATATVLAFDAAQSAIRPVPVVIPVVVDAIPLLNADANAQADLIDQLDDAFAPFVAAGCRIGFIITEGNGVSIEQGNVIADEVNVLIELNFPDLAEGAGFYSFANVGSAPGPVSLRIFPNAGCTVTSARPTVARTMISIPTPTTSPGPSPTATLANTLTSRSPTPTEVTGAPTVAAAPSMTPAPLADEPTIVATRATLDAWSASQPADACGPGRICQNNGDIHKESPSTTPMATEVPTEAANFLAIGDGQGENGATDLGQGSAGREPEPGGASAELRLEPLIALPAPVTTPLGPLTPTASGYLVATDTDGLRLAIATWTGEVLPLGPGYYPQVLPGSDQVLVAYYGSGPEAAVGIAAPAGFTPLTEPDPNGAYRDVPAGWLAGVPYYERTYPASGRVELWQARDGGDHLVWARADVAVITRHPLPVPGGFLIGTAAGWVVVDGGGGETWVGGSVPGEIRASVVSGDGQWLAYTDGAAIWLAPVGAPGELVATLAGGGVGTGFAFAPSGQYLAVGDGAGVTIYDLGGGVVGRLPAPAGGTLGAPAWGEGGIAVAAGGAILLIPAALLPVG